MNKLFSLNRGFCVFSNLGNNADGNSKQQEQLQHCFLMCLCMLKKMHALQLALQFYSPLTLIQATD